MTDYDALHLLKTAHSQTLAALRRRGLRLSKDEAEDLAQEALVRALEGYDAERTDNGPIVLLRWRISDVISEYVERTKHETTIPQSDIEEHLGWQNNDQD